MVPDTIPEINFTKEVTYHYEFNGFVRDYDYYINEYEPVRSKEESSGALYPTTFPKTNTPYQVVTPELIGQIPEPDADWGRTTWLLYYIPDIGVYARGMYVEYYGYDEEGNRYVEHAEYYPPAS